MVSESRPVELWGLRTDDYGEVTSSEITENRKYEGESHVVDALPPSVGFFSLYQVYSERWGWYFQVNRLLI